MKNISSTSSSSSNPTQLMWYQLEQLSQLIHFTAGSHGGLAVTRLAFQAEDPGSMPGAGSNISFISSLYTMYIHCIHHRPTDGKVKWPSRVSELYSGHLKEPGWLVEFHVSLYPISVSPFFPLSMLNVWYNDLNILYSAEWWLNSNSSSYSR